MSDPTCPFCARIAAGTTMLAAEHAAVVADAFPVSPGHALVVPRRHVASYFELDAGEQAAIWALVSDVQRHLEHERHPAGYNIGINVGAAAGQTVAHAHVHVIPRYAGDVEDPRGGVRRILAAKAAYWEREG